MDFLMIWFFDGLLNGFEDGLWLGSWLGLNEFTKRKTSTEIPYAVDFTQVRLGVPVYTFTEWLLQSWNSHGMTSPHTEQNTCKLNSTFKVIGPGLGTYLIARFKYPTKHITEF